MKKIKLTINGKEIIAKDGEMILDVAKKNKIHIPHLCLDERLERIGACRLCVVEINNSNKLFASCCTPVREGIIVNTHSPKVLEARRINLELLFANHDLNCVTCERNRDCKLQMYAEEFMIKDLRYFGEKRHEDVDNSSVSIRRDNNKCILCERCIRVCNEIQTVYAIGLQNRGFKIVVKPPFEKNMDQSSCVNCGQCVISCPTGALTQKSDISHVIDALNSDKYLIVQTAPSIRATLGECFNLTKRTVTGKMVTALKEIGFNKVFNTDFAADITIVEEATEFIKRFKKNENMPMITTCCPAWIKFGEQFFYDQLNHMSSCRSPQAILASLTKTYFAKKMKINPKDIILVDIMPCTAKKYEILRPEFFGEADYVLTTIELAKLLKQLDVDFENLEDSEFDNPLGESSGAAAIFGRSGGVMEAALRTAADWLGVKDFKKINFNKIHGMKTLKEAKINFGKKTLNVCVVHTLGEARKIMEQIKNNTCTYDFIEVMACYGGCIGGGGQPHTNKKKIEKRIKLLNDLDSRKNIRLSHKNPSVIKLYKEYLGEYGGKKAHKLLHTTYTRKDVI
ncbi:MAG: NADH-dependent [FeFe] hydrogenase, group A6 [Candidatus Woesearchaeota archaeon]